MLFLIMLQAVVAQPAVKPQSPVSPDAALRAHVEARDVTLGGSENSAVGGKAAEGEDAKTSKPQRGGSVGTHSVAADAKTTVKSVQPKVKTRPKG